MFSTETDELFRSEVSEARKAKLTGDIVIRSHPIARVAVILSLAFLVLGGLWATATAIPKSVTLKGTLSTSQPTVKIIIPTTGIIKALLVKEGQKVRQGSKIVEILTDRESPNRQGYGAIEYKYISERIKLLAHKNNITRQRLASGREKLNIAATAARQQWRQIEDQIKIQNEIVESNQESLERTEALLARGYVTKMEHESQKQKYLSSKQSLLSLQQQLVSKKFEEQQTHNSLKGLSIDSDEADASAQDLEKELRQQGVIAQGRVKYIITAPRAGIVTALQSADGRTIESGLTLLSIVPENSGLIAEVYAPTSAAGLIKNGQSVRLMYDALPYRQYGTFKGTVLSISRDTIDQEVKSAAGLPDEPVYKVRVALEKNPKQRRISGINLQPGMTLSARIVIERRSLWQWLVAPLRNAQKDMAG